MPAKLLKKNSSLFSKGFTLIELLVVIAILSILTVLAVITLNPAEAQRKARDVQRLKDLNTVRTIVEQAMADNPGALTFTKTSSNANATPASCSTGWLSQAMKKSTVALNLCNYASTVPVDPVNGSATTIKSDGTTAVATAVYTINLSGSDYKICTYLEAKASSGKLTSDGEGTTNNVYAVFTDDAIACP